MRALIHNKKVLAGFAFIFILGIIALTISLLPRTQENRTRATDLAGPVSLYFQADSPSLGTAASITPPTGIVVGSNSSFHVDLMIDPKKAHVSFVKLDLAYDPNQLIVENTDVEVNRDSFKVILDAPIIKSGHIYTAVSIGANPLDALDDVTRVARIYFRVVENPGTSTQLTINPNITEILSLSGSWDANQNVYDKNTQPFSITFSPHPPSISLLPSISETPSTTITPPLSPTSGLTPTSTEPISPTPAPTDIPIPTSTLFPTPTPIPDGTTLSFTVYLHNIGNSGDNVSSLSSLSNKTPIHPQRPVEISLYDRNGEFVASAKGVATYVYDPATREGGFFTGLISFNSSLNSGAYAVKIKSDRYLRGLFQPIIMPIIAGQLNKLAAPVTLVAGDVNDDNLLNIFDYNVLYACFPRRPTPRSSGDINIVETNICNQEKFLRSDLNDNGILDQLDMNLFLRELSVQKGQ